MKVEDGKGSGRLAEVDENNRLSVSSISSARAESSNIGREAFILASEVQLIGAAAEHRTFYISNGESSRDLIVDIENFCFDGGTTSNTKPLFVKTYLNGSVPTANNVSKDPLGLNTETGQSAADFEVWDGVGTGFTQAASGDLLSTLIYGIGCHNNEIPSKLIIGPAKTLTYSFECEEACKVSSFITIHLL